MMRARTSMTFFDAILEKVDLRELTLQFQTDSHFFVLGSPHAGLWTEGSVGSLTVRNDGTFRFYIYPDQRLRRATFFDDTVRDLWGWSIADYIFQVRANVIPGVNGQVVKRDVHRLNLDVPAEFRTLCDAYSMKPEDALKSFIADVCGLHNLCVLPREDGYTSCGSDERLHARQYWTRAHGWRLVLPSTSEEDEPLLR